MKKEIVSFLVIGAFICMLAGCANSNTASTAESSATESKPTQEELQPEEIPTEEPTGNPPTNDMGGLSPEDALEYMKNTPDLIIVDVAATRWYDEEHFENAINIPIEELNDEEEEARYMEIPAGHPVLLHCRRGMIVPGAYERVKELRSDIPEISYIDGNPPFAEYNEWLANQ